MTSASSADSLQSSLGYRFNTPVLLDEALTHSSLVNEQKTASPQHNERQLEGVIVGGAVIGDHGDAADSIQFAPQQVQAARANVTGRDDVTGAKGLLQRDIPLPDFG